MTCEMCNTRLSHTFNKYTYIVNGNENLKVSSFPLGLMHKCFNAANDDGVILSDDFKYKGNQQMDKSYEQI